MLASVVERYGAPGVIELVVLPMPAPQRGQVLVRVEAAAVTAADSRLRAARFPPGFGLAARLAMGVRGPRARTLGNSFSGVVERVGAGVSGFAAGDEVAGMTGSRMGSHAEHAVAPVTSIARKPSGVSHPEAAGLLFGGTTALYFLRDRAGISADETVLVNGASGAVGSSAVQLAHHFGAIVTAVTSTRHHELVRRLGATTVIDHTTTPVAKLSDRFDIVLDTVGNISRADGLRMLTDRGRLGLVAAGLADVARSGGRVLTGTAPERASDIALLLDLADGGDLDPVTRVVGGLDSLVEAHRIVDSGRKVGNLVVLPHGG